MGRTSKVKLARFKRKARIRKKIFGTSERPRLTVYRSNRFLYAQAIDDSTGNVVGAASSKEKGFETPKDSGNKTGAAKVGKVIAERLKSKNIQMVVFDRNGYQYHGCVKSMADAIREAGLKF